MEDVSGLTVAAGAFGVVSVSALLMLLIQRIKDYAPSLSGRRAMFVVDVMSLLVTVLVIYQTDVDWEDPSTYIAIAMGTLSLGVITRGHYAAAYHVKVEGQPLSAEATVPAAAVDDPQIDAGPAAIGVLADILNGDPVEQRRAFAALQQETPTTRRKRAAPKTG